MLNIKKHEKTITSLTHSKIFVANIDKSYFNYNTTNNLGLKIVNSL